ncbi:HTH-type transcriptional repressor NsrR [Thalassovita gelatinovora]|uniref:HTH-type transcriptional repressor NsrR n=1 Tax=Thalassovita gelatinovora TaxID=53501 RepID=A0A0P1FQH9_THAGE|nr:Rrf2 family transcriptional regulator [Thalassovita gelatinovora]QIZ80353.1 Rrf2 family transcriptional regulator [Thalassovita gelatinovora]CUH64294.1 HTH-type transcriptional repressor NsrR [Thalassovita gelatinovora]SEQ93764.1 transcriptional regulator, BadM/Rrf2 family [Thalassovita gelatinovora]
MRVTKRTNIAIRILMYCAAHSERLVTKSEIAERCNASENHLAQVINQMGQLGYLHTQRGRNGGITLARDAKDIWIGEVFRVLEGPVPLAECFADADNTCPLVEACRLKLALVDAAEAFYRHLDAITLDALVCDNLPLLHIMKSFSCGQKSDT